MAGELNTNASLGSHHWGLSLFLRAGVFYIAFPLTPTLSLGERETNMQRLDASSALTFAESGDTILPLPKGEGRGEGERGTVFSIHSKTCMRVHYIVDRLLVARRELAAISRSKRTWHRRRFAAAGSLRAGFQCSLEDRAAIRQFLAGGLG